MDTYFSEIGLAENDIIFIELMWKNEWLFELDMNDPKFFDPYPRKKICEITSEEISYQKYWENFNNRPFNVSVESSTPSAGEYQRIKTFLNIKRDEGDGSRASRKSLKSGAGTPRSHNSIKSNNSNTKIEIVVIFLF